MKRTANISDYLSPLCPNQTQCYLTNTIQVADIIEWVIPQMKCSVRIFQTSFSISEEFLRRLFFIKRRLPVTDISLLLDFKATNKTLSLWSFITQTIPHVYLADNHSKIILIQPNEHNANGDVGALARGNDTKHCGDDTPSCRSGRKTRLTIPCPGDVGALARGDTNNTTNVKPTTCNQQREATNATPHTPPAVAIITSQNLTRGNRHESAIITTDPSVFATLYTQYHDLVQNHSVPLSELYNAQINP